MNVLTKLFVVLLVVCSLLLSAAVVVFVNRVEDYKRSFESNAAMVKATQAEVGVLQQALVDKQKEKAVVEEAGVKHEAEKERQIADLNTRLSEKDTLIAGLNKEKDIAGAKDLAMTRTLDASTAQNKELSATVTAVRTQYDGVVKQFHDLNVAITVAENKIRALTKQNEYSEEVISDLTNQVKILRDKAPAAPGVANAMPGGNGSTTPRAVDGAVPDIKGVVRSVDMISGKKYATISVGSSSAVTKGMKFTIVNRQTGDFLGYVTIDNVQPDEAIGQVDGPQIDKIQAGVDVRTQL